MQPSPPFSASSMFLAAPRVQQFPDLLCDLVHTRATCYNQGRGFLQANKRAEGVTQHWEASLLTCPFPVSFCFTHKERREVLRRSCILACVVKWEWLLSEKSYFKLKGREMKKVLGLYQSAPVPWNWWEITLRSTYILLPSRQLTS